jgi:hypothetical protein
MAKAASKESRKVTEIEPFDKSKIDLGKAKPEISAKELQKLVKPPFNFPGLAIEMLTPTKTVGRGRTNLTLIATIFQTDATVPRASFDLRNQARRPVAQMHFQPSGYGITSVATYINGVHHPDVQPGDVQPARRPDYRERPERGQQDAERAHERRARFQGPAALGRGFRIPRADIRNQLELVFHQCSLSGSGDRALAQSARVPGIGRRLIHREPLAVGAHVAEARRRRARLRGPHGRN